MKTFPIRCLLLLCLTLASVAVNAQQEPLYTQYMFNMLPLNPAYAGSRKVVSINALYRYQWAGVKDAPQTATLSADMPLQNDKLGIGLTITNDRIHIFNSTQAYVSFAYRLQLKKSVLAFGMHAGLTQNLAQLTAIRTDPTNALTDPAYASNNISYSPNIGAGVYYSGDKFYLGLSVPKMLGLPLNAAADRKAALFQHIYLMGGYVFNLGNDFKLKPSSMVKYVVEAPLQVDLNANLWIYDKFGVGASYRTSDIVCALLEWQASDQLRIGYAFDWTFGKINTFTYGSHEILIRYELGYNRPNIVTPRYF